jgi:phospholipase C
MTPPRANHYLRGAAGAGGRAYHGLVRQPKLWVTLSNGGTEDVTFTVTPNHYSKEPARTYHVHAHSSATHLADPLAVSTGWYDVSVTISSDRSWSRRYIAHVEDGNASTTG